MKIGCHISVEGGLHRSFARASALGCESFQIFTRNQRQWRHKELSDQEQVMFRSERSAFGYEAAPLCSHGSYLVNLCAADPDIMEKSIRTMKAEIDRCERLGIDFLIIHPGAHGGKGELRGIALIAENLDRIRESVSSQVPVLLETVSGQGTSIGYRFAHLRDIIDRSRYQKEIGVCLDTCHLFAAGYPVMSSDGWEEVIRGIDSTFGWETVGACHLNDSLMPLGSRKDRHARLGGGRIGWECFRFLMTDERFRDLPGILEVPGGDAAFGEDMEQLRRYRVPEQGTG